MRRGTPADAEMLLAQTRAAFARYAAFAPAGWALDRMDPAKHLAQIRATLENPDAVTLIAEHDRGHVAWRPEPDHAYLLALFVEPAAWGTGLAVRLHAAALETMAERGFAEARLFTPEGQARSRRFYEREGWDSVGEPQLNPYGMPLVEYRRGIP